jgi:tetratricopeptide (TPR) repeat protein
MRKELLAEVPSWHFYRYGVAHTQTWFADLLLHTGRLSEAEAMLSEAIGRFEGLIAEALGNCQTNRRLAICYEMLGEVLWITDRPDDAKQAMRRAVILMERNAADYPEWNRFKLHLLRVLANSPDPEIRDPARAVELARDVLDRAPDNSDGWLYLGVAHLHLGEWQSAATALERSMELEPEVIEFHSQHYSFQLFGLAIARWQLGEAEAARELYDEAVETMLEESAGLGPDWVPRLKIRRLHDRARAIFEDGADGATAPDSPVGR